MPSTVIAHMVYYPEIATLRITYVSGEIYDYKKVPVDIYKALKLAPSKGEYLNKVIKKHYPYKKVS
ncbi:KTSC domain-containing protein [Niastella caeni]|uniref:KTSC domain-containing protein n=1 Tax=Niastella caeni TaxID=2569763 RepID=A0A4S8HDU5_9BACT|nr:KTSC domain-containing protein [Niastella caeni]THU32965.1 KTSC domain-containing protein [Niastella caeni]